MNMLLNAMCAAVCLDERDLRQIRDRLVGRPRVRHHKSVLALDVLEKIIDSKVLHHPAAKRQIDFAVLDAVGDFLIVAGGSELKVGESRFFENVRNDFLDVLLQKNTTIGLSTEQPQ